MTLDFLSAYKTDKRISSTTDDTRLSSVLQMGIGFIENWCNRKLEKISRIETFTGNGETFLQLHALPIDSTVAIVATEDGETIDLTDTDTYKIDYTNGRIYKLSGGFFSSHESIIITYTGGYTTTTMPETLKAALYMWVSNHDSRNGFNTLQVGESLILNRDSEIMQLLSPHKIYE